MALSFLEGFRALSRQEDMLHAKIIALAIPAPFPATGRAWLGRSWTIHYCIASGPFAPEAKQTDCSDSAGPAGVV